jgi:hypothetical protein
MKNIIVLPTEKPELEKFAYSYSKDPFVITGVLVGAKWQADRMYSEEDMRECWKAAYEESFNKWVKQNPKTTFKKWFEKFKKVK